MNCQKCKSLVVDSFDGSYIHQLECPDYISGLDADKARKILGDIKIGTLTDTVLEMHQRTGIVVATDYIGMREEPLSLVVAYALRGITLTMARGYNKSNVVGNTEAYAVQKIEENTL